MVNAAALATALAAWHSDPLSPFYGTGTWEALAPVAGPQGLIPAGQTLGDYSQNALNGLLGPNALPFSTSTAPLPDLDPFTAAGFNMQRQPLTPVSPYSVAWSALGLPGVLNGLPVVIAYASSGGTRTFGAPPAGSPAATSGYTVSYTPGSTNADGSLVAGKFFTNAPANTHSSLFMW